MAIPISTTTTVLPRKYNGRCRGAAETAPGVADHLVRGIDVGKRTCCIEGCGKPHFGRGWCSGHYDRWRNHGDPLGGRSPMGAPMQWLQQAIVAPYPRGCLTEWPFARHEGYPVVWWNGRVRPAPQVVLELTGRPQPAGEEARHLCGNGHLGCLHPEHLAWGTRAENEADKVLHGTSNRGERSAHAKLTRDAVLAIRASTEPGRVLAARYGVGVAQINGIRRREKWAWL